MTLIMSECRAIGARDHMQNVGVPGQLAKLHHSSSLKQLLLQLYIFAQQDWSLVIADEPIFIPV